MAPNHGQARYDLLELIECAIVVGVSQGVDPTTTRDVESAVVEGETQGQDENLVEGAGTLGLSIEIGVGKLQHQAVFRAHVQGAVRGDDQAGGSRNSGGENLDVKALGKL